MAAPAWRTPSAARPTPAYGETLNGVQVRPGHQFDVPVDPYVTPGDPASGLLPGIDAGTRRARTAPATTASRRTTSALCLTDAPPTACRSRKPAGYDPARYELLLRYIEAGDWDDVLRKLRPDAQRQDRHRTTTARVSTDYIGAQLRLPDGDYAERERIFQDHVTYQQG